MLILNASLHSKECICAKDMKYALGPTGNGKRDMLPRRVSTTPVEIITKPEAVLVPLHSMSEEITDSLVMLPSGAYAMDEKLPSGAVLGIRGKLSLGSGRHRLEVSILIGSTSQIGVTSF